MKKFISKTVFNPIGKEWYPDKVLAVLFHRSAATLYLIYFFWALSSIFWEIPSIILLQGDVVQIIFSIVVMPIAFCAFIGALYFPKLARLEMYAASSLVTLVVIYEIFIAWRFFLGDSDYGVSFILNLSHLVIPVSRIIFTYVTLVKQAGDRE